MQLTVRDVSRHLNESESTVMRWIKQRGLPAQKVNGQYRVNRAELLEWATVNNIHVAVGLFDHLDKDVDERPRLGDALELGGIHY